MIELMLAAFVGAFLGSFIVMWATLALDRKRLRKEIEASAPPWIQDPATMFDRDRDQWKIKDMEEWEKQVRTMAQAAAAFDIPDHRPRHKDRNRP